MHEMEAHLDTALTEQPYSVGGFPHTAQLLEFET